MNYIKQTFDLKCKDAVPRSDWCVALMSKRPYYGGPEEGGWWGDDIVLESYKFFNTEEEARCVAAEIETLAQELSEQSRQEYGERCIRTTDWLDERGLDADFLPEPDGPEEFFVEVSETIPEDYLGTRGYS